MRHWTWLILAALLAVALCLARYIGLAIVLGAVVFLKSWRDRIVVAGIPSLLAVAGLFVTRYARPAFPAMGKTWSNLLNVAKGPLDVMTNIIIAAVIVGMVVFAWRQDFRVRTIVAVVLAYIVALAGMVYLNKFDPLLDIRLFVPIAALLWILGLGLAIKQGPRLTPYLLAGVALFVGLNFTASRQAVSDPGRKGLSEPRLTLANSPAMRRIAALPDSVPIYTNQAYGVWLQARRVSKGLPVTKANYDQNPILKVTMAEVRRTGGLLAWFDVNSLTVPPDSFVYDMDTASVEVNKVMGHVEITMLVPKGE